MSLFHLRPLFSAFSKILSIVLDITCPFSDFTTLFDGVHRDVIGLNGSKLRLEHVPICSCVMVKGLNASTKEESIKMYFENTRRSGGNVVSHVERKTKDSAVVFFEDPTSKEAM